MNEPLLSRISSSMLKDGLSPAQEMISFAVTCDSYSNGVISADDLQLGMCKYLDESARRSRALSEVIHRVKEPPLSEVFTECTIMTVDAVLRSPKFIRKNLKVTSENNIKIDKGKYVKPDVAIWRGDKIVGVIECKTSLGRARKEWENAFNERIKIFESVGIDANSVFLFVASETSWQGFSKDDPRTFNTLFSLCPKGTWFGGGKQGEVRLSDKMNQECLKKLIKRLEDL